MANLRTCGGLTWFGCQPGAHLGCGTNGMRFIKDGFKLLSILRADKPAHMSNHRIHIECEQYPLTYWILMPEAGNIQLVADKKCFNDANQLDGEILFIAAEAIRTLQI